MAATNKAIIDAYKAENGLPVDTPLYTWAVWHNMGYQVRKGEKCKHRVQLWRYGKQKIEQDREDRTAGRCFYKTMSLFGMDQVEKITAS